MNYLELMEKSDNACLKAIEYFKQGEFELARFYKNASIGFKNKARNLKI